MPTNLLTTILIAKQTENESTINIIKPTTIPSVAQTHIDLTVQTTTETIVLTTYDEKRNISTTITTDSKTIPNDIPTTVPNSAKDTVYNSIPNTSPNNIPTTVPKETSTTNSIKAPTTTPEPVNNIVPSTNQNILNELSTNKENIDTKQYISTNSIEETSKMATTRITEGNILNNSSSTDKPILESTIVEQNISNEPKNEPNNENEEDKEDNIGSISLISKEEAQKLASISLSYEKINNFNYDNNNKITFDLSTLTTVGEINIGDEIKVYVNLIYSSGMIEAKSTESICVVQNIQEQSGSARAKFLCTIENLESKDYYSLRYNNSESICGVPNDEILLDPVLTNKYKSNIETKILPTFESKSIDHSFCPTKGVLTITGKITEKLDNAKKINIPLTYPEGITLTCEFNDDQDKIECKADREINNKTIIIEQTVIKNGNEDYFNLKSIITEEKISCSNALLQESLSKQNSTLSFRQVSHFQNNNDGFSFVFIGLSSKKLDKGSTISINININNESEDREITCTLENDVEPDNNQIQANYLCSVNKNTNDYWNSLNYQSISVSISQNNNIGGVSELDETSANPAKTDEEIQRIKQKRENNEDISDLENIIDYYETQVEVNVLTLESIDMDKCNTTGKLTIKGTFSNEITEKINFDLPLSYPNEEFKCELNEVSANTLTTITCKAFSTIISIENIVIEKKMIKKKSKELFIISGKSFNLNGKKSCENYDTVRRALLEQRMNSKISFSLMENIEIVDQALQYFMAFERESDDVSFEELYSFVNSINVATRRFLRVLDTNTISDIPVTCRLNQSLVVGSIGGYNCKSDTNDIKGTLLSMTLDTDEIGNIQGIDNVNLKSTINSNNKIDYTNIENLKKLGELPNVNIISINGESCSTNGQYIIYGLISDATNVEEKYSNINIFMSSTNSIGLCEVNINKDDKNITIICQNKDKFDISQIRIEKSLIQDSEGNNIFQIRSYTSPEQFSCDISLNSLIITEPENTIPEQEVKEPEQEPEQEPESTKKSFSLRYWGKSNGLSGGTIAAIVIPIVLVVIALVIVFILMKKGFLSKKNSYDETSTIKKLNVSN